jgi:Fe-S cluster biogenesis protein NfuA
MEPNAQTASNATNATNPTAPNGGTPQNDLLARLENFIDSDVRPFLQQDGGDIELKGVEDGIVLVNLHGACGTCPSSIMTLQFGVERRLKEVFPTEVKGLQLVNSPLMGAGGHGPMGGHHPSHY